MLLSLGWVWSVHWPHVSIATIAALSLLLNAITLWRQYTSAGRANLTADWDSSHVLRIVNHGPGVARRVELNLPQSGKDHATSLTALGPLQSYRLKRSETYGAPPPTDLHTAWRDRAWTRHTQTIPLSAPPPRRPSPAATAGTLEAAVERIASVVARGEMEAEADFQRRRGGE